MRIDDIVGVVKEDEFTMEVEKGVIEEGIRERLRERLTILVR